jgi:hypothetical protein
MGRKEAARKPAKEVSQKVSTSGQGAKERTRNASSSALHQEGVQVRKIKVENDSIAPIWCR